MKQFATCLFFTFAFVLATTRTFGTAQDPDVLIYKGKKYDLYSNPLEEYFVKVLMTSNWRGYVATFELIDSTLYLKDIEIYSDDQTKSVMNIVFPGENRVAMEWFNGLLTLPYGKVVHYVHMGYSSEFENYIILEIRIGRRTKSVELNHDQYIEFKEKQFELFKRTKDYEELVSSLREQFKSSDIKVESFIKIYSTKYLTYFMED